MKKFNFVYEATALGFSRLERLPVADALAYLQILKTAREKATNVKEAWLVATTVARMGDSVCKTELGTSLNSIKQHWASNWNRFQGALVVRADLDSIAESLELYKDEQDNSEWYDDDEAYEACLEDADANAYNLNAAGEWDILEAVQTVRCNDDILEMTKDEAVVIYAELIGETASFINTQIDDIWSLIEDLYEMIETRIEELEQELDS